MEKIYSKVKPDKLLHIINRFSDIDGRTDIVPKENFLQCASLNMNKGDTFKPHKHVCIPPGPYSDSQTVKLGFPSFCIDKAKK